MVAQVSVLEGDLPQPDALRLLDDGVLDLPELFLLGQLFLLSGLVVVVAFYLALEGAPLVVAAFTTGISSSLSTTSSTVFLTDLGR